MIRFVLGFALLSFSHSVGFGQAGDFDQDGLWDCRDLDSLTAEIVGGGNDPTFDLTGDGDVSSDDLTEWLALGGIQNVGAPYLPGDGNLDGSVDASDHMIWNANKYTINSDWCSGDFNADGYVDVRDFNIWNDYKFQSSGSRRYDPVDPSPIDDAVDFIYDVDSGLMTIDTNGLDISCFSVYGIAPEEFLLNGGAEVDVEETIWEQDHFLGHSKWFSLDLTSVNDDAVIARFEPGLTIDDFDYVTFGTADGLMGRGNVTIVGGALSVPEPATSFQWIAGLTITLFTVRRKRSACPLS